MGAISPKFLKIINEAIISNPILAVVLKFDVFSLFSSASWDDIPSGRTAIRTFE
jgi:hypothetical protein